MNYGLGSKKRPSRMPQDQRSGREVGNIVALIIIGLISLSSAALADEAADLSKTTKQNYYEDAKRGYYWYEKTPEKPQEQEKKQPLQDGTYPSLKEYAIETLWNMDPGEFSKLREAITNKSIRNPNDREAMQEYFVLLDLSRRKSLAWANSNQAFLMEHPEYNTASVIPSAAPGQRAMTRMQRGEIEGYVRGAQGNYALVFFHSPSCKLCTAQEGILDFFRQKYAWNIKSVNTSTHPDAIATFNVQTVPTLLLVSRLTGKHLTVSVGVSTLTEIEEAVYRGARLLANDNPGNFSTYDFERGSLLDPYAPLKEEKKERRKPR